MLEGLTTVLFTGNGVVGSLPPMRDLRSSIQVKARLTREEHIARFGAVHERGLPCISELCDKWAGKTLIIVGGGPSLQFNDLSFAISSRRNDVCVMALNKSHDWLVKGERDYARRNRWKRHPIIPEFAMMIDPKDWCVGYMTPHAKPLYLFGTSVSPLVLDKFKGTPSRVYQFYPLFDKAGDAAEAGRDGNDLDEVIQTYRPKSFAVLAGGSNVGMRALNMASLLGFTTVELWGFDSCAAPGADQRLYAYDKPSVETNYRPVTVESKADGAQFRCVTNGAMALQITQFSGIVKEIEELRPGYNPPKERAHIWAAYNGGKEYGKTIHPMRLRVAGDGAIPWMAWKDGGSDRVIEHTHPERMAAKYGASRVWDYSMQRELEMVA